MSIKRTNIFIGGGISKTDRASADKRIAIETRTLKRFPMGTVLKTIPRLKMAPRATPNPKTFHF
jgi:hypothetical protein